MKLRSIVDVKIAPGGERVAYVDGRDIEFDIYPRGGHVLREPMLQREQMKRNLEWFERWISVP